MTRTRPFPPSRAISRRSLMTAVSAAGAGILLTSSGNATTARSGRAFRQEELLEEVVIDLSGTPESIDPALAYSPRDWSVVHSIYDALITFDVNGQLVPLAAETFTSFDDRTFEVVLRSGLRFHDGSPVDSASISRSVGYLQESDSFAVDLFRTITGVDEIDARTARIVCSEPSPWLPAQMAVWLLLVPDGFTAEQAATAPIGSGPFEFVSYSPGDRVVLKRNEAYTWESPKGQPIAQTATFRFVPESSTRIADLSSGAAQIVTQLPPDQLAVVEASGQIAIDAPIVGSAWIRIATDVEPFNDARVRRALNHAIDVSAIAASLVSGDTRRLAMLYPDERALGFNPELQPYEYDPELARSLLGEAGIDDGLSVGLEITSTSRADIAEAIAAQLGEVGLEVDIITADDATFNAGWGDPARPPLRMSTWVPLYDPHTLLSLVFASEGFLSRYENPEVDALIKRGASQADPSERNAIYQELGRIMHDDAPAIFLWNLTSAYGVAPSVSAWQPRGDEYVIPTVTSEKAGD